MICERCHKKEASVFYEETVNGTSRSLSLCRECAEQMRTAGEMPASGLFSLPYESLFGTLFGHTEGYKRSEKSCPLCGATFHHFSKDGKVGCPECYRTFANELNSTVRSIHGTVSHVGRAPVRFKESRENENVLSDLKLKLKAAIDKEDFELAATLRDTIRDLEANEKET